MPNEKFPLLDHLNPLKDVAWMRSLEDRRGPILLSYRNFFRGAVLGTLTGLGIDNTIGNGGIDLAIWLALVGAVSDGIQGLGRGAVDVAKRMGNSSH